MPGGGAGSPSDLVCWTGQWGRFFFLGIGLASVKQLVAVDIGFTHLAVSLDPHQRPRWGSFFGIRFALDNQWSEHGAYHVVFSRCYPHRHRVGGGTFFLALGLHENWLSLNS